MTTIDRMDLDGYSRALDAAQHDEKYLLLERAYNDPDLTERQLQLLEAEAFREEDAP